MNAIARLKLQFKLQFIKKMCLSDTENSKVMADYPSMNATDLKLQFTAGSIRSNPVY